MKTIIEMAREAGIRDCTCDGTRGCLERFAEIVRADEREVEREECAKVCEDLGMATNGMYERNHECAAAIRARGNT